MGRALDVDVQPYNKSTVKPIEWSRAADFKFASKQFANYTKMKCIAPEIG